MATVQEFIKRMLYQFTSTGAEKVAADANKVGDAITKSTQQQERATLSLGREFSNLERRFNDNIRKSQDYEKVQQKLNAAVAQNPALQARANEVLRLAADHYGIATARQTAFTQAQTKASAASSVFQTAATGNIEATAGMVAEFGKAGPIIVGVAAVLGLAAADAVKSVQAFGRFEEQMLAINAVLAATRNASGQTQQSITALVDEIGNISKTREAALELLRFGNIAGDQFKRALVLADDLAAAGFGSVTSAANLMGKALTAPEEGLTRLRRVGINFTDGQIATAKRLVETGKAAEAQDFVLSTLEQRIGGTGAARDKGLAGAFEALSDASQRSAERWGEQITKGLRLTEVIKGIATAIDEVGRRETDPNLQLGPVDAGIAAARRRVEESSGSPGLAASAQRTLQRLLQTRDRIVREIAVRRGELDDLYESAGRNEAAGGTRRMEENIQSVITLLNLETEALKKNAFQREVDIELRKAQIDFTNAPRRDEVERAVALKMTTALTEKSVETSQLATAQLKIETATVGMSVAAATAFRVEQNALAQARIKGIELTQEQTEALRKEAVEQGKAAQVAALRKYGTDTDFQRNTAFMSDIERQIATDMRALWGNDWPDYMNSREAAERRWLLNATAARDVMVESVSSFVKDLAHGVALMDALRSSARKLGDSLIDAGVKALINQGFASVAGGLGGSATMTAGATGAATILTGAGATLAASMIAGATEAAAILGVGGATAGTEVAAGGAVAATEVAVGGGVAGVEVAAGGAAAAFSLEAASAALAAAMGNPLGVAVAVGAIAAGAGLSFLGMDNETKKKEEAARDSWKQQHREFGSFLAESAATGGLERKPSPSPANDNTKPESHHDRDQSRHAA